jgi:endo-1,4-beta-xylanase
MNVRSTPAPTPGRARNARRLIAATTTAMWIAWIAFAGPTLAQSITLRPLADDAGVHLGAAVDPEGFADAGYTTLLVDHVNTVSTRDEVSMAVVQPEQGVFDFGPADAIVDFAVEHDMAVRGHDLIDANVPAWVAGGTWTADTLGQVLRDHVTTVVDHFTERNPGVVIQWDVVGDAFLPDGTPRPTIWQQVIGDEYLRIAFDTARSADPDAQLFYDDFYDDLAVTQDAVASGVTIVGGANASRTTCDQVPKCVGIRDRIATLLADGVPIDGIGIRSHLFSPDPADLTQLTAWVADLGLNWAITEFDVPLPVTEITSPESLEFQATQYGSALAACVDASNCDTFVVWGITDRYSPIPSGTGGAFDGALWFDENDAPKPAFDAMADVLTERATPTTSVPAEVETTHAPTSVPPASESASDSNGSVVVIVVGLAAVVVIGVVLVAARRRRDPGDPSSAD